jgi:hypothetical protein
MKLFGALLFSMITSGLSTLRDCSSGNGLFTMISQGFSPEPPVPGQDVTLWFYYQVPDGLTVTAGTAKYSFTFNGIPFSPTVEDLCTQVDCPLLPGIFNLTSTSQFPSGVSGKITSKIQWYNEDGSLLLCSELTEKI